MITTKQILDRFGGFRSYVMTDIRTLVCAHYAFCRRPDSSSYVADILYKDKFFCDDIKNMSNGRPCCRKRCLWVNKTNMFTGSRQCLASIIIDAIISAFYKATHSTELVFNPATPDFFTPFCSEMLAFLFAMVHCGISEQQSGAKV